MSLRRYVQLKPTRGTVWPKHELAVIRNRDGGRCIGHLLGFPGDCFGGLEPDHVRAGHGIGIKSRSTADNGVSLCSMHHRWKTENGKAARPLLLDYLSRFDARGVGI